MSSGFLDWPKKITEKAAKSSRRIQATIFAAIVSPVIFLAVFGCVRTYQDLTEAALSRRQSIATFAAAALEERFQRLSDIGISLATRVRFRQLINEAKWEEAIQILKDVRTDFPFIDRLFIADPTGTLMTDNPALPEVRGKNFAIRDWYQGVSANWKPYISDVYQRAAEPRLNVVATAIPINDEKGNVIGILVLQVQLNDLVGWSKASEKNPSEFIYFVDKKGQLATHRNRPSEGALLNYLNVPVVQKLLRGQSGVERMFSPLEHEERIAAYAPLPRIGWGVIASEPAETAFKRRNETLKRLVFFYGLMFLISCVLAYIVIRTMAELKLAEEKISTLNKDLEHRAVELEAANKELEAFSYSVSHDLRAPLRTIDGFSQALLEDCADKLDAQGRDDLQRVRAASQQMAQLIDDMLELSRVTRVDMRKEPVDLTAMARTIAMELKETEPERHVEFAITEGFTGDGDPRLLRIVLENLLRNAWKFTAKHPAARIEFGLNQSNGQLAYFIRDDGAGFDMKYADKLFGAFQRLHAMTEFKGTGVGLATVQRIIRRHGGRVWAEGKVEQGATFYFTLT